MNLILILLFLSPIIFALMNVCEKYTIAKKTKNPLSFAFVSGSTSVFILFVTSLFLDWKNVTIHDAIFPIIAGCILGLQYYFYYTILKDEDISTVIGLYYTFPLLVAIGSYIFLNEKLSSLGYLGSILIISGAIGLSIGKIKKKSIILYIVPLIIIAALGDMFIKIATNYIENIQGVILSGIAGECMLLPFLFNTKIRNGIKREWKNIHLAVLINLLSLAGMFILYASMRSLAVTLVSSITAAQPLFLLFFEKIADKSMKIAKEKITVKKTLFVLCIIIGSILLYATI